MNPDQQSDLAAFPASNGPSPSDPQCPIRDTAFSQGIAEGKGGRLMSIEHCENGHPSGNPDCPACKTLSILRDARRVCEEARRILDEV